MSTYVVKSGDNLSTIGAKYGVNYRNITGYRSGNANLIYPGEVLTIPDGKGASAAPSGPAPKTQAQLEEEAKAEQARLYGIQTGKYNDVIGKQKKNADSWAYNDVLAASDPGFNSFIDRILAVNRDAYSNESLPTDYLDPTKKSGPIAGMGGNFQDQLAISAGLYAPEWQREINRDKEDRLVQEVAANGQYGTTQDSLYAKYAVNGIQGGLKGAEQTSSQAAGGNAFQQQAKEKQRFFEDWKRKQKETLLGYAAQTRNEQISKYNNNQIASSGITDKGLIDKANTAGNQLLYNNGAVVQGG